MRRRGRRARTTRGRAASRSEPQALRVAGQHGPVRLDLERERCGAGRAARCPHPHADAGADECCCIGAEPRIGGDQVTQRALARERRPDVRADDRMRLTERHAGANEILREVGRRGRLLVGGRLHGLGDEGRRGDHPGERRDGERDLLDRVEQRFLVLLQVTVVGER